MPKYASKKWMISLMCSIGALTAVICSFIPLVVMFRDNHFTTTIALVTMTVLLVVDGICVGVLLRARKFADAR